MTRSDSPDFAGGRAMAPSSLAARTWTAPSWRLGVLGRSMARDALGRATLGVIALSLPIVFISLTASFPLFALSVGDLLLVVGSLMCVVMLNTTPVIVAVMIVRAYGRFLSDSLVVALYASGRSTLAVAMPGLAAALVMTLVMAGVSTLLAPAANRTIHDMLQFLRRNMDFSVLEPNRFYDFRHERITFYFAAKDETGRLKGVFIHKRLPPDERGVVRDETYSAREALVVGEPRDKGLLMLQGNAQLPKAADEGAELVTFESMIWRPQTGMLASTRTNLHHDEMPTFALLGVSGTHVVAHADRRLLMRELVKRLAYPVLPLTHVLLGLGVVLAFASPAGRGRGTEIAVGAAVAVVLAFHTGFVVLAEGVALLGPVSLVLFLTLLATQVCIAAILFLCTQRPRLRALLASVTLTLKGRALRGWKPPGYRAPGASAK